MIIHQIFFKVGDKTFDDYPCYVVGMSKWKQLCEEQGTTPEEYEEDTNDFDYLTINFLNWLGF